MDFEGEYGVDLLLSSTNTLSTTRGGSIVADDGTLSLYGNVWKSYKLSEPYNVTGNTHIAFKFELTAEAEGHAICVEDDLIADSFGGVHRRCLALAGTQYQDWDDNHVKKGSKFKCLEGSTCSPRDIKIGHLFPEVGTQIKYIAFVQDNDALPFQGSSKFWNIELYETAPVSFLTIRFLSQ